MKLLQLKEALGQAETFGCHHALFESDSYIVVDAICNSSDPITWAIKPVVLDIRLRLNRFLSGFVNHVCPLLNQAADWAAKNFNPYSLPNKWIANPPEGLVPNFAC